jgi:hypothetical protein
MTLTFEDAERVISAQKRNNVRSLFLGWCLAWLNWGRFHRLLYG